MNSSHIFWFRVEPANSISVCVFCEFRQREQLLARLSVAHSCAGGHRQFFQHRFRSSGFQELGVDSTPTSCSAGFPFCLPLDVFFLDTSFGRAPAVVVHVVRLAFSNDAVWLSHLVLRETLTSLCSIQLDGRNQELPPQGRPRDFRCGIRREASSHLHCHPTACRSIQNSIVVCKILHAQNSNQPWLRSFAKFFRAIDILIKVVSKNTHSRSPYNSLCWSSKRCVTNFCVWLCRCASATVALIELRGNPAVVRSNAKCKTFKLEVSKLQSGQTGRVQRREQFPNCHKEQVA